MSELTPYLCVPNARMAVDWHCRVLGAAVSYEPILMEDNRIGHVEPSIGGAGFMMADEFPEQMSGPGPWPRQCRRSRSSATRSATAGSSTSPVDRRRPSHSCGAPCRAARHTRPPQVGTHADSRVS